MKVVLLAHIESFKDPTPLFGVRTYSYLFFAYSVVYSCNYNIIELSVLSSLALTSITFLDTLVVSFIACEVFFLSEDIFSLPLSDIHWRS